MHVTFTSTAHKKTFHSPNICNILCRMTKYSRTEPHNRIVGHARHLQTADVALLGKRHFRSLVAFTAEFALWIIGEIFHKRFQGFTGAYKKGVIYCSIYINLPLLRSRTCWWFYACSWRWLHRLQRVWLGTCICYRRYDPALVADSLSNSN